MKTEKSILFACLLNLIFAIFEFCGGFVVGSMAIVSDAVHDLADALGIGVSYIFEKISKKALDEKYTFGYGRFSVLGGILTMLALFVGSSVVLYHAIIGFSEPAQIRYRGMILFAVIGICVNFAAVLITHKGESVNQRAVSLHMLEDVLGWIVVLVGAVVMYFTDFVYLDAIMSVALAVFMMVQSVRELKEMLPALLEKAPEGIDVAAIKAQFLESEGVREVRRIHIWSIDGRSHCAALHLVADGDLASVKAAVREILKAHGIDHATVETDKREDV